MNALSTQQLTPSEILMPIFTAKITRRGVDQEALMDEYLFVLKGMPRQAVVGVVNKIRTGQLSAETDYCPLPPELANMVREEWRIQRMLNEPKPSVPKHSINALDKAKIRWKGHTPIDTDISLDTWQQGCKTGRWPVGATFSAIQGHVYAAFEEKRNTHKADVVARAMRDFNKTSKARKDNFDASSRMQTDEEKDYWRKISFMPDADNVTPSQAKFRDEVEREIDF